MATFAIFEQLGVVGEPVVVAQGFSGVAALLPPGWLGRYGMWLELMAYAVALGLILLLLPYIGGMAAVMIYISLALWIGFEAPELRAAALGRRGWVRRADLVAAGPELAQVEWLKVGR